ncbi:Csu type fimbrial protein [Paraburkholderia caballeronis]|uniref:Csu type fimbrial protein n=1 Tax=Paraburkholderia caballeronis TaxID=416943 RepID=UPI001066937B|nr:spore coat U domain-containing protein [Paraburkholderia caballeronis]TDV16546.1 spore coat protein U-like protein [Paraburkholderia caballeronis]TDV18942.1 spore coat protein U-like protein [Paraburkholderia caballeronis]TDV27075.1 spore coat protein U-like protein [Paraburkholderia caballeronis]
MDRAAFLRPPLIALLLLPAAVECFAQTATTQLGVAVTVLPACEAGAADGSGKLDFGTLDFGTHYALNNGIAVTGQPHAGAIRVKCASGVGYRILMNGGGSGSVAQRRMRGGPAMQIAYNLYTDAGYSTIWDDVSGVSVAANGSEQWTPVFGRVPAQPTPQAGSYTDVVTVTVSW